MGGWVTLYYKSVRRGGGGGYSVVGRQIYILCCEMVRFIHNVL